jgi:hypothetical protein
MRGVDLANTATFVLGVSSSLPQGTQSNPIWFPKGTYRLGTPPQPEALKNSAPIQMQPLFDVELRKQMLQYQSIEGWVAFDRQRKFSQPPIFKIAVRDSSGTEDSIIVRLPRPTTEGEADTGLATMRVAGPNTDLSRAFVKFYSDP